MQPVPVRSCGSGLMFRLLLMRRLRAISGASVLSHAGSQRSFSGLNSHLNPANVRIIRNYFHTTFSSRGGSVLSAGSQRSFSGCIHSQNPADSTRKLQKINGVSNVLYAGSQRSYSGHRPPHLHADSTRRLQRFSGASNAPYPGSERPDAAWVRQTFVDFFRDKHGHQVVPSSPVRPRGDPSLLFVNAGMNQFKPVFLGTVDPRSDMAKYRRVVNSQKCVRAGGKHNDLEDVGRDVYHHTFFEMMGSWSFGDYFKEEAILMAWSLLTQSYGLSADRLYVSYFSGDEAAGLQADHETRDIWLELGLPPSRVLPFGPRDNFWEMGDSGPCGPCSEIHYDHVGGREAAALVNSGSEEVVEIWNLVFMQYNREADSSLQLLPRPCVDTGLGLERLVSILQSKTSNYDTDLFTPLLDAIHQRSQVPPYSHTASYPDRDRVRMAYRVVADHIRTLSVCIADGVHPGMTGAELVLRRILRRAVRFCSEVLKAPEGTLAQLVPMVTHSLGGVYPELYREADRIMQVVNENESQFLSSLQRGSRLIHRTINKNTHTLFPASVAWSLHRDLGFPLDLIDLMLEEKRVRVDRAELDRLIEEKHKMTSDPQSNETSSTIITPDVFSLSELKRLRVPLTDDSLKYQYTLSNDRYVFPACSAVVLALYDGSSLVSEVTEGQTVGVILDRTSCYSEQGGQSHDQGYFTRETQDVLHPIEKVSQAAGFVLHQITAADTLRTGDTLTIHLDQAHRLGCMQKHTATHLLNLALRKVLGPSVEQRGSHVSANRLRFDFNVKASLSVCELQQVDRCVSEMLSANHIVYSEEVPMETARRIPGLRTVDEVYPDPVRVVSVGLPVSLLLDDQTDSSNTSVELCCGTHIQQTAHIRDFLIVSERQTVKGISRVIALTGQEATQAREAGLVLKQEVDSLENRLTDRQGDRQADRQADRQVDRQVDRQADSNTDAAYKLAREVGVLSDAVDSTPMPQWQRRELQARLKTLQRSCNTTVRKMETRLAQLLSVSLVQQLGKQELMVAAVETHSLSVLMKTVNQLSSLSPLSHVMLLAAQVHSGKVLCACQVPKDSKAVLACDWALAVCGRGQAGGSALVAKGTGSSDDITQALKQAEEFYYRQKRA